MERARTTVTQTKFREVVVAAQKQFKGCLNSELFNLEIVIDGELSLKILINPTDTVTNAGLWPKPGFHSDGRPDKPAISLKGSISLVNENAGATAQREADAEEAAATATVAVEDETEETYNMADLGHVHILSVGYWSGNDSTVSRKGFAQFLMLIFEWICVQMNVKYIELENMASKPDFYEKLDYKMVDAPDMIKDIVEHMSKMGKRLKGIVDRGVEFHGFPIWKPCLMGQLGGKSKKGKRKSKRKGKTKKAKGKRKSKKGKRNTKNGKRKSYRRYHFAGSGTPKRTRRTQLRVGGESDIVARLRP